MTDKRLRLEVEIVPVAPDRPRPTFENLLKKALARCDSEADIKGEISKSKKEKRDAA